MKGIFKLLIIVVLAIFMLPSCGENKDVWEPEIDEYRALYLGDSTGTPDAKSGMVKAIYSEDDFICYAEQSEYTLDFEEIHIILKSTTGEQWFMYCTTPALEYFDTVNFGKRLPTGCTAKVGTVGLGDYVANPAGNTILYNCIPDSVIKEIEYVQNRTHGVLPVEEFIYKINNK